MEESTGITAPRKWSENRWEVKRWNCLCSMETYGRWSETLKNTGNGMTEPWTARSLLAPVSPVPLLRPFIASQWTPDPQLPSSPYSLSNSRTNAIPSLEGNFSRPFSLSVLSLSLSFFGKKRSPGFPEKKLEFLFRELTFFRPSRSCKLFFFGNFRLVYWLVGEINVRGKKIVVSATFNFSSLACFFWFAELVMIKIKKKSGVVLRVIRFQFWISLSLRIINESGRNLITLVNGRRLWLFEHSGLSL